MGDQEQRLDWRWEEREIWEDGTAVAGFKMLTSR